MRTTRERSTSTLLLAVFLGLGALSLGARSAAARDLTGEFSVSSQQGGYAPVADMDASGEVVVVWADIYGRRFDRNGNPRGDDFQVGVSTRSYLGPLDAALDDRGFTVSWQDYGNHSGSAAYLRRFDREGQPLTGAVTLGGSNFAIGPPSIGTDGQGRTVAVASEGSTLFAWRFDAQGRQLGSRFRLTPELGFDPKVAVDADGRFAVVWLDARDRTLLGRRFDAAGRPLGATFPVTRQPASEAAVAGNAQGSLAVAWSTDQGIFAHIVGRANARPAVLVSSQKQTFGTAIAMDALGRFLVTWSCCASGGQEPVTVFGRFFEASGTPLDRAFPVSLKIPGSNSPGSSQVLNIRSDATAGPAGDFLVVWQRIVEGLDGGGLVGRFLSWAPRGADPCLSGAGTLACDVSRDGGMPEVTSPLARRPGDVPLLGDLDDDRRDDPCLFRGGRFLCDTAHDGTPDLDIAFGQPGDAPLLGDLDGEGRADPCVRRGGQILCDAAHNGGTAEVVVTFGAAGSRILLGDVDGDGDDDPCAAAAGRLSCDTEHDGGAGEVQIPFALQAGDVPLLGDADGDGRADPCVFRGGRFLCDARRSGKLTLLGKPFAADPGAVPVLGDVNGF